LTKVLVAFATRFGSTREIASAIARELNTAGFDAIATEATSSIDATNYDALVIGSPIYGRKWLATAGLFATINSERISGRPVALFSVGTLGVKNQAAAKQEHEDFVGDLREVAPKLNVVSDDVFNGYFERANLPWYLRLIDRFAPTPEGDHRDWQAIESWAKSLVHKFR
tara:strand:+ start:1446 stop:1952 length:507 start_codon:yes stop_codon:yes gene_type:complete